MARTLVGRSVSIVVLACSGSALAQTAPAPAAPETAAPAVPSPPAPGPAAAPPAAAAKWYDKVKLEGFVDAYASVNYNFPKPQYQGNLGRAFDTSNGFALHWVGLNASYAPEPVGATVGLRFGPGAFAYNGAPSGQSDWAGGAGNIKQAFVSWKPGGGALTLDFGKFDTWIGAEVADSQYNMNYTRSFLFVTQPLFHTGLRLDYAASEQLDLKLFAVNGWNNTFDNNSGKSFGAEIGLTPSKEISVLVNWIGGPEQADTGQGGANSRWRHLFDAVVDLHPDKLHVVLNGDLGMEATPMGSSGLSATEDKSTTWYGGNLTAGYAFTDQFSAAIRGGYFQDPDGWVTSAIFPAALGKSSHWFDGTLTLAASPTPNLIIKLDGRIDSASVDGANDGIFPKNPSDTPALSKTQFTTTLGVVATTN